MLGKKEWAIPDGYMNATANGNFVSHEAICILNTGDECAEINFDIYFEDREPMCGFYAKCEAKRTNHIRLDKVVNALGEQIPKGTPYAILVTSSVPVVIQHSRMDVSQKEMALMTTIAY